MRQSGQNVRRQQSSSSENFERTRRQLTWTCATKEKCVVNKSLITFISQNCNRNAHFVYHFLAAEREQHFINYFENKNFISNFKINKIIAIKSIDPNRNLRTQRIHWQGFVRVVVGIGIVRDSEICSQIRRRHARSTESLWHRCFSVCWQFQRYFVCILRIKMADRQLQYRNGFEILPNNFCRWQWLCNHNARNRCQTWKIDCQTQTSELCRSGECF